MMKKRLLSIFTSLSITASTLAMAVGAAPALAGTQNTADEFFPEPEQIIEKENTDNSAELMTSGPAPVLVQDTAEESNTEFITPELLGDAILMDSLEGEGTEEAPYLISSADDLFLMAHNVNSGINNTSHYKLTCDIDLEGREWVPIGHYTEAKKDGVSFCGVFDGDGHTVSNFKITDEDSCSYYIGLFGFVSGGTIKNVNVDSVTIDVDIATSQSIFIGGLAGRIVTRVPDSLSSITHCNVSNLSIKANDLGSVYAGGISGSVVSGDYKNASIFIAFSSVTDTDISISSKAKYHPTPKEGEEEKPHLVRAGGFIGFISAQTNSTITVINSSADANVFADASKSSVTQAMAGGMFSDIWTYEEQGGGAASISACYSSGTVEAHSDYYPYVAGGFAAQIYPTKDLTVTDCYSNADVSGKFLQAGGGDGNDPTAGGFVGQIFFEKYITSYGKTIKNCYGSGNVKDLTHTDETPKDYSFVGGFMGWSTASIFENCFRFEAQSVIGSDLNYTDFGSITVLTEQDSKYIDKYVGFDMNKVWEMDPDAEYFYPTLREKIGYANFVHNGVSFATDVFGSDGRVGAPSKVPSKSMTVENIYTFLYWSLSEDGASFNFTGDTLTQDTTLYAVFRADPRPYRISFINEGMNFVPVQSINYGSPVKAPNGTPEKAEEEYYYYTFSHWSDIAGGTAFDFSDYTVVGDKTFYAVYNAIDKRAWTGTVAESFSSGFGTKSLPYVIKTADEFALFAKVINENKAGYTDAYYALGDDINLGNNYWTPIGDSINNPFSAHFDGKGYTVNNFKMASSQYGGLFGTVVNAEIKNVNIAGFEYTYSFTNKTAEYPAYAGVLAGYVRADNGDVEISGVRISDGNFNVTADVHNMYVGNIAGFAIARSHGNVNIHDCFATNPITVNNSTGYAFAGGLVGKLYTGPGSLASVTRCYNIGKISATSYHSAHAGGLVGYAFSYGSKYVSNGYEEKKDDVHLSAANDDLDMMVVDCFANAEIYSHSKAYTSYAGIIAAEFNVHAGIENTFYPSNVEIPVTAVRDPKIDNSGKGAALGMFQNADTLTEKCGFDFENTWTFVNNYSYPVLKCMVADKEILKVVSARVTDGTLDIALQVLEKESNYAIVIGVYNKRNQLMKVERKYFSPSESIFEFNVSYDNMKNAEYIAVSAVETATMKPLFEAIKRDI